MISKDLTIIFYFLCSSVEDLGLISDEDIMLRVTSDGHVVWGPPMMYITHCEVSY